MWLMSALVGLSHGGEQTDALVNRLGLPQGLADPLRISSCALDILVAATLVFDQSAVRSALLQLVVVLGYTLVIGFALPELWFDPLGSLLKNIPVMVAIAIYGIIGDKR